MIQTRAVSGCLFVRSCASLINDVSLADGELKPLNSFQALEEELLRHQPASLLRVPLQEGVHRRRVRGLRSPCGKY